MVYVVYYIDGEYGVRRPSRV